MTDELKPCAHCGSDKVYYLVPIGNPCIICPSCHSCFTPSRDNGTKEEVISSWNTRHESDMLPQWIKNCLFDKMDDLRDIVDSPFVVPQIKGAVKAQIDMIEWMLTLRKPEDEE